uniref:Trichome birefringence-like C-terminal domain-containing protein n=1 Tax=Oryza barthii TaxID=65489 RepID=A0A0D3FXS0_9ORYZ
MAGAWRKAWLSVLDRGGGSGAGGGGGGSSGSLHVHLHGLLSPSSSSSSLNGYKRGGGKHGGGGGCGGGHVMTSSKAVLACFSVALVVAFFYVSVASGPTADAASFPSPTGASSSSLLSWLSSNSTSAAALPRRSLPPHPPIPPAGGGADLRNTARRTQSGAEGSGLPAPAAEQTAKPRVSDLRSGAGNATVGDVDGDQRVENGTRSRQQRVETATPMPRWQRRDEEKNSTHHAIVAAPGNSTDAPAPPLNSTATPRAAAAAATTAPPWHCPPRRSSTPAPSATTASSGRPACRVAWSPSPSATCSVAAGCAMTTRAAAPTRSTRRARAPTSTTTSTATRTAAPTPASSGGGGSRTAATSPGEPNNLSSCELPSNSKRTGDHFECICDRSLILFCFIRLNPIDFLERLRGQRIIFVGDSLNRNMWESLVCILRHGVRDKRRMYEASGRNQFKTRGYYSFRFRDYNCSVDFIRSIFLVKEMINETKGGAVVDAKLRLDELDETTPAYRTADIVVFNTGHWWTHWKTSRGYITPFSKLNFHMKLYTKSVISPSPAKPLIKRCSCLHRLNYYQEGQWNSGGRCHRETEPIFNRTHLAEYPEKMRILEQVLGRMRTPVIYLNISAMTDYRKDAHPSVYRVRYETEEERMAAVAKQDCSHWCLPGVPDSWNELLYASLLQAGRGSWSL